MSFVHIHNSAKFTTEICVIDYTAFMQLLHNLDFGGVEVTSHCVKCVINFCLRCILKLYDTRQNVVYSVPQQPKQCSLFSGEQVTLEQGIFLQSHLFPPSS